MNGRFRAHQIARLVEFCSSDLTITLSTRSIARCEWKLSQSSPVSGCLRIDLPESFPVASSLFQVPIHERASSWETIPGTCIEYFLSIAPSVVHSSFAWLSPPISFTTRYSHFDCITL
jgi:hypothetical protein